MLVVLVIFLFLGSWRATLIPAVTVPLCLLGSFAVLWLFGFSINLLTLLAMVLSIGIVVDDAIVVLENVYHRIEEGEPPLEAAYEGTRQVGFAIISTTLVVCAVFVPIMFITGQTGLLFRELAVAMIGAVAFSGFLALSLAPMLCSKLLRHEERGRMAQWVDNGFRRVEARYATPARPRAAQAADPARRDRRCSSSPRPSCSPRSSPNWCRARMSASSAPTSRRPKAPASPRWTATCVDAQGRLLKLTEEGAVRAVIQRTPGGFGASDDFNSGAFTIFLKPWEERDADHAGRGQRGQQDPRPDSGGPRQRVGALVDRPRPGPAGQFRHRRRQLTPISPAPATASSRRRRAIPASSISTATIRKPSRSSGSTSTPTAPATLACR